MIFKQRKSMQSSKYKILINDRLLLNCTGQGALYDYFYYQYREMATNLDQAEFTVDINFANLQVPKFEKKLAFESGFICRADKKLYWVIGNSYACLEGFSCLSRVTSIQFSGSFPKMKMNNILEIIFRLLMSKKEIFLLHGAGLAKNNCGILIPAWKGVGKTALCLSMIERNYSFLADDRLWVDNDGGLIANQRYVVIQDSNASYFPQFAPIFDRFRRSFLDFFESFNRIARSKLFKLVKKIFQVKPRYYKIHDLYPSCNTMEKAALKSVIYLSKSHAHKEFFIEAVESSSLQQKVFNISMYEWNLDAMRLALARDTLFVGEFSWRIEIERFTERESQGLLNILSKVNCYEMQVPAKLLSWDAASELIADL